MNRAQKELVVKELQQEFADNSGAFIVKVKGITVNQMQNLRKGLHKCGGRIKVAKDRLVKIAIKDNATANGLAPYLNDQVAVVFAKNDSAAIAKLINESTKNTKLEIVIGLVDSQLFDKDKVVRLASLPSREVLLAQLCGLLNAPVAKLARALDQVAQKKGEPVSSEVAASE